MKYHIWIQRYNSDKQADLLSGCSCVRSVQTFQCEWLWSEYSNIFVFCVLKFVTYCYITAQFPFPGRVPAPLGVWVIMYVHYTSVIPNVIVYAIQWILDLIHSQEKCHVWRCHLRLCGCVVFLPESLFEFRVYKIGLLYNRSSYFVCDCWQVRQFPKFVQSLLDKRNCSKRSILL